MEHKNSVIIDMKGQKVDTTEEQVNSLNEDVFEGKPIVTSKEEWAKCLCQFETKVFELAKSGGIKNNVAILVAGILMLTKTIARFEYEPEPIQPVSMDGQVISPPTQPMTCATCGTFCFIGMDLLAAGATVVCPGCGFSDWVKT